LKGVVEEKSFSRPPAFSKLNFVRTEDKKRSHQQRPNFVASLREIPHSTYSSSRASSQHNENAEAADANEPLCAICMEKYSNGDAILTLACSHCFHSDCVSKWFYQDCLNSTAMISNFSCPHCRRNHRGDASTVSNEGISSSSLLRLGQNLLEEGGYDLLNDVEVCTNSSSKVPSPRKEELAENLKISSLLGSTYSSCGIPL